MPRMGGRTFRAPQVPSTLPTLDEVLGSDGLDAGTVNAYYLSLLELTKGSTLRGGLNVHTVHTEMEGGALAETFGALLDACREDGMAFATLREALAAWGPPPEAELEMRTIPGRAGPVAVQVP